MKAHIKERAMSLRTSGHSYAEISALLGISKSTASLWTRRIEVDDAGISRLTARRESGTKKSGEMSHARKLVRMDLAMREANRLINAENREALVVLSMLYLCEGSKTTSRMCFTNSDPETIRLFLATLRTAFPIDERKFGIIIHMHDYHDENELRAFWSRTTGIPVAQFNRSFRKTSDHAYQKAGYMGCIHVSYYDMHVCRVVMSFAKELAKLYI